MELLLRRKPAVDRAILGDLFVDGRFAYVTLERQGVEIPAARYRVSLTVSQRATDGQLWSPDPDHRLPLVMNVPGRSGIRVHAANEARELQGCIAIGLQQMGVTIRQSRAAVTQLFQMIAANSETWLTIENPTTDRAVHA